MAANTELLSAQPGWAVTRFATTGTNAREVQIPAWVEAVRVTCEDGVGRVAPAGTDGAAIDSGNVRIASGGTLPLFNKRGVGAWTVYVAGDAGAINCSVDTIARTT